VRTRLLPLVACLSLVLCGCGRPTDVAEQFHDALAKGDGAKAFGMLSQSTQAKLTRIAKAAHEASGGAISEDAAEMIVRGDGSLYPARADAQSHVVHASLLSANGPRAKVSVRIGETTHEMDLVKEGGHWKIDLPLDSP
jgi:hypothetical protein